MSEARNNVTPFRPSDGFSRSGGLNDPLGGALGGTTVAVDMGELEVEAGVDDQGNPVVRVTAPAVHTHDDDDQDFGENLAERLPDSVIQAITEEVIEGVSADEMTRQGLMEQYREGLDLLGGKIEEITASQGQKRGISRLGDTTLIECMIKYHAGALAELLPAAGPAKVSTTGRVGSAEEQAAQDFADMFNYYLTEIATEYYPDTSQMLMHQGYCGNAYKKIYRCPMRNRPVSESVRMMDLIVSEEAVNLDNALRVTHQFYPSRAELKRMMILGRYRDVSIPHATAPRSPSTMAIQRSEGIAGQSFRPQDVPLYLYETDLSLETDHFQIDGKFEREAPEGLPLPYKVTVIKDSRVGLGIWRNWEDGDDLYQKNNMFVRYGLVPGLGFHQWGFLQLVGNQTKALRAITRLLVDAGMFSMFPGGVKIKGARTSTNEIAPGPGEWVDIDVPGATDIRALLMPLPYKQLDAVFVQFAQMLKESAMRLGGTVEMEVGEGRTNIPVGTIMSQIEQSTQMMAAVHKSNHRSQKEELLKLRKLFIQNPEDLWRLNPNPATRYQTAEAFKDMNLLPASDPNVPAQVHRIMQIYAVMQLVQQTPMYWDMQEVLRRALQTLRVANAETLLLTPEQLQANQAAMAPGAPPPDPAKMMMAQARIQQTQMQHQGKMAELAADAP